jgi:hypothetical protein
MKWIARFFIIGLNVFLLSQCTSPEVEKTEMPDSIVVQKNDTTIEVTKSDASLGQSLNTLAKNASDENYLFMFEKTPMGFTSAKVKNTNTTLGAIQKEDNNDALYQKGLTEAKAAITFLNYPATIEYNFKNDTLYRYSIIFKEANEKKSQDLFNKLNDYYVSKLGPSTMVNNEEDNHYNQMYYWKLNPDYLITIYNLNTGRFTIAVQTNMPGVVK